MIAALCTLTLISISKLGGSRNGICRQRVLEKASSMDPILEAAIPSKTPIAVASCPL